jgi:hypothetical protein
MIGIITGAISGIDVIDTDSQEADEELQSYLSDFFICPTQRTPGGGKHYVFAHGEGIRNSNDRSPFKFHVRGEGGYFIGAPSENGAGRYQWLDGLSIEEVAPPTMPDALYKSLSLSLYALGGEENARPNADSLQFLTLGTRDNDLFHAVNCLSRGGYEKELAYKVAGIIANNCNPPFDYKEAMAKVDSAYARTERTERNLTEDLRRWIDLTSAYFSLTEAYSPLQILTSQKNTVHQIMHRLVKEGYVERHPNKNGIYRRIDKEVEFLDFANADIKNTVDLRLPLGLHVKTKLFPKGAIVIAGVSGMGKTLFCFNTIAENRGKFPIFYFNSEMGPEALNYKLSHFPIPMSEWEKHMKVIDNWDFNNIPDKIQPDAFNVIDYLEPEGDRPYNIHGVISAIIRRLNKGTALITVQKKPDAKMGTGGIYSIKAATLAIALDWGKIEIVKNRFREADLMPSLNKINFEIHQGYKFMKQGDWYR